MIIVREFVGVDQIVLKETLQNIATAKKKLRSSYPFVLHLTCLKQNFEAPDRDLICTLHDIQF